MNVLVEILKALASSRLAELVWDSIVDEDKDPRTITLGDLLDEAAVRKLRRAAAMERARRRKN